jgi:TatD DNase family protein
VTAGLIDSHCHLQSLKPEEREPALDAARERGVTGFLVPGIRLSDAETLLDLCHRHDDVWCALGLHPHHASEWQEGDDGRLAELAADPKVVAIGECGLDFHYDHSPRDVQGRVLRRQWRVALDLDLPVILHNRESNDAMVEAFEEEEFAGLVADFHSFAGGRQMAERLIPRGAYFGFSGMITFNAAGNVREVIPLVAPERVLVETDTPYLAPVPYRGQPNRPAYVVEVARRLAEETGETLEQVSARTGENFRRLFYKA